MAVRLGWIISLFIVAGGGAARADDPVGLKVLDLDRKLRAEFDKAKPGLLPELQHTRPGADNAWFNWAEYCPDFVVHDQRDTSTCWAHAAVEMLECSWAIRNARFHSLSAQPILDRLQTNDTGYMHVACDVLVRHGTDAAGKYKFTGQVAPLKPGVLPYRAIATGPVVGKDGGSPTARQIKEAILEHGPVGTSLDITKRFNDYAGGVLTQANYPAALVLGRHSVVITGWDDKKRAWRVKNSWGRKWGEKGYAWVGYGSLKIGESAHWIEAQATYYRLPPAASRLLGGEGERFPNWEPTYEAVGDPKENFEKAEKLRSAEQWNEAIELYHKVLVRERKNDWAWFRMGECYQAKLALLRPAAAAGNRPAAWYANEFIEHMWICGVMCYRHNDKSVLGPIMLGFHYQECGDPKAAFGEYNAAIKLDPKDWWAYRYRGELLLAAGRTKEAFQDFDTMVSLEASATTYECRAAQYTKIKKYAEARADTKKAAELRAGRK